MIPLKAGAIPVMVLHAYADTPTTLDIELRTSDNRLNHTPEITLEKRSVAIHNGRNCIQLSFETTIGRRWIRIPVYYKKSTGESIPFAQPDHGILSLFNTTNVAVSNLENRNLRKISGSMLLNFGARSAGLQAKTLLLSF
jgi:hypothetical protein